MTPNLYFFQKIPNPSQLFRPPTITVGRVLKIFEYEIFNNDIEIQIRLKNQSANLTSNTCTCIPTWCKELATPLNLTLTLLQGATSRRHIPEDNRLLCGNELRCETNRYHQDRWSHICYRHLTTFDEHRTRGSEDFLAIPHLTDFIIWFPLISEFNFLDHWFNFRNLYCRKAVVFIDFL